MNLKKANVFISNNLKLLSLSIAIGLFACAISIFAFSSPGSNQPPNGNPSFWLSSGTSMYYSGGSVGIGTTSPNYKLDISGSGGMFHINDIDNSAFVRGATILAPNLGVGNHITYAVGVAESANNLGSMYFRYAGAGSALNAMAWGFYGNDDLVSLLANGNVGIGTTAPGQKLSVAGTIESTSGGIKFPDGTTQTTTAILGTKGILQIIQVVKSDTWSSTNNSYNWQDVTGMSATITPTYSSSKVLITFNVGKLHNINGVGVRILRNGAEVPGLVADAASTRIKTTITVVSGFNGDGNHSDGFSFSYLDSPGTTSSVTYKMQVYGEGATTVFNRSLNDADSNIEYSGRATSNIILMEYAP